jgi:uncharacterized protein (DUF2141 family)
LIRFFNQIKFFLVTTILILQVPQTFSQDNNSNIGDNGTITIKITGFDNDNGECWFALDNSKEVYESEDSVFIGKVLPIINRSVYLKIDSLEFGYYAIKVFHNENSNGKMDFNFLGIPSEDYGYSNNVSGWFGPPEWEKAKFIFNQHEMIVEISID